MRITAFIAGALVAAALDNGRAVRPPMGWRSWNQLGGSPGQTQMQTQMAGIVDKSRTVNGVPTSLAELGYNDVGLDDFWQQCGSYGPNQYTYHNAEGTPMINYGKFPDMLAMTTYAHSLGLTAGWYGNNCGCHDHCTDTVCYQGDVSATFELGFDSTKLDGCGAEYNLTLFADLFNQTGRAYLIENCHWGYTLPTRNPDYCPWSYYRSSGDIRASYGSIVNNLQTVIPLSSQNLSWPNCWAFPDALEVGVYNGPGGVNGDPGLSYVEARSHFAAWCVMSSPLIIAFDTTNATAVDSVWDIVSNQELIAVNQAYYGSSGNMFQQANASVTLSIPKPDTPSRSAMYGDIPDPEELTVASWQLFAKPLNASAVAVLAMNHGSTVQTVQVNFADVPGLNYAAGSQVALRDLYNHTSLGYFTNSWSTTLASHDSAFVIITA